MVYWPFDAIIIVDGIQHITFFPSADGMAEQHTGPSSESRHPYGVLANINPHLFRM
jgi:hypothetical protein